jgi:hypothetical protein
MSNLINFLVLFSTRVISLRFFLELFGTVLDLLNHECEEQSGMIWRQAIVDKERSNKIHNSESLKEIF